MCELCARHRGCRSKYIFPKYNEPKISRLSISEPKRIWNYSLKCLFFIFAQNHNILGLKGFNKAKGLREHG